jgi:uncharacterized protein (DUF2336 family)
LRSRNGQALSEAVTDLLVERGDRDVVRSVAQNSGARSPMRRSVPWSERSVGDEVLAVHVGTRRDLPRQHLLRAGRARLRGGAAEARRGRSGRRRARSAT